MSRFTRRYADVTIRIIRAQEDIFRHRSCQDSRDVHWLTRSRMVLVQDCRGADLSAQTKMLIASINTFIVFGAKRL